LQDRLDYCHDLQDALVGGIERCHESAGDFPLRHRLGDDVAVSSMSRVSLS
jgi:hypothetical protein